MKKTKKKVSLKKQITDPVERKKKLESIGEIIWILVFTWVTLLALFMIITLLGNYLFGFPLQPISLEGPVVKICLILAIILTTLIYLNDQAEK